MGRVVVISLSRDFGEHEEVLSQTHSSAGDVKSVSKVIDYRQFDCLPMTMIDGL